LDSVSLPANARIDAIAFDDATKTLTVRLRGDSADKPLPATSIAALFGARIRHESVKIEPTLAGISLGKVAMTAATGIPVGISKGGPKEKVSIAEELHYALAMRADGVDELWYLIAASFNFRKTLGPEATYSGEMNVRLFVKRLARFAPQAVQDGFFAAIEMGSPLPPPMEALRDFLRYASAK
jgi:hypothetical protein